METTFFFWLSFSLLLVHEMDAVRLHEWRIFPMLSHLDDRTGYAVFTLAHIPLYVLSLCYLTSFTNQKTNLILGLDGFAIIHIGLHWLLRNHPRNEFTSLLSWGIIVGAGVAGLVDLLLYFI
jgi:hypothetical protein